MDLRETASTGVDPAAHWYYRTKKVPLLAYARELLRQVRTLDIVDIGAGSGFFSDCLAESFGPSLGAVWKADTGYASRSSCRDGRVRGEVVSSPDPPEEISGALVLMMDVLEHAEDDGGLLRSVVARGRGRNYFFITAPAFMSLWSGHDRFLGHHRRYRLDQLRSVVSAAGIRITSAYYIYGLIFPGVWLWRRWGRDSPQPRSDLKTAPRIAGFLLEWLCRCEFLLRRRNTLFGLTCVIEGAADRAGK